PWHSQRDRLLEAGAWFAGVCGTLGKFANDFSLLMQTEVAEVGEPWHSQRDRLLEAGAWFAGVCGTLGKFANDFSL
ncbi:hypothetical protein CQA65_30610, partial [Klebsiella pneumoniae]